MHARRLRPLTMCAACALNALVAAQSTAPQSPPASQPVSQSQPDSQSQPASRPLSLTEQPALAGPDRVPWNEIDPQIQEQLAALLKDVNWPIRVFGLLRLERYVGEPPEQCIRAAFADDVWQVRCFAIRAAARKGMAIDPAAFKDEMDPKVLRAALREGVALGDEQIKPHVLRLLKTRGIEELVLGLELAACCADAEIRAEAEKRATRLIKNMDDSVALLIARRLALVVGLTRTPDGAREWRAWLASKGDKVTLTDAAFARRTITRAATPLITGMDDDAYTRLLDYLSSLKQRDLDLVIVMDATASMIPMVNQARAGIDSLILFMRDISRNMRIAFVAYRDHDNEPVWDGHPFTNDITSIRKYLFDLRITGGADYPEAVLEGLTACGRLDWNGKAEREVVLVGDAPPHDEDVYQVHALLDGMRDSGVTVNAVHVPMAYPQGMYERLAPPEAEERRAFLEKYNTDTARMFEQLAEAGGGRKTELGGADALVPAIMRFTIEEAWWPAFDEFYAVYLELCR